MKKAAESSLPTLAELAAMSREELQYMFQQYVAKTVPRHASQSFMRGHLAWNVQARRRGVDPAALRSDLINRLRSARPQARPLYKPGTRLIREWRGVTHEVTIEESGYSWNGRLYRNLSEVARLITGTRWSGPRFFGLTDKGKPGD